MHGGLRLIAAGTLHDAVVQRSRAALASGALEPVSTELATIDDAGVRFAVHRVSPRARRVAEHAMQPPATNPFLPADPALVVGDLSPTHRAVLNKFPVRAEHVLLVTRDFVHQETLLDADDCAALATGLAEIDAIAFYNAGVVAGASQPHRHLQLIPLPLVPAADALPPVPIETLLDAAPPFGRVARLPFAHAFARLSGAPDPAQLLDVYHALLAAAGLHVVAREIGACASAPYNLLATRRWMLVVPRSQGRLDHVSINALGYAGSFFARDAAEEETLRRTGPMAALQCVALPLASLPA